jgi:hypothetical protein
VRTDVPVTPLYVAEIVTAVLLATAEVVMVNAGETVLPAATVTDAGTTAAPLLLMSFTTAPPAGAAALRVTVLSVVEFPPTTIAGDSVTVTAAGPPPVQAAPDRAEALPAASNAAIV